ncbi:MAG: ribosome maturation factor RimM [Clostridia bacterium]
MKNNIVIGKVLKPQGIKGDIKILPLTDNQERFNKLDSVTIKGVNYKIEKVACNTHGLFLKLLGLDDRTIAESLRGEDVIIPREKAIKLPKDRYFVVDMIGIEVFADDVCLGKIIDILQYGSADIYCVKAKVGNNFMFPALAKVIIDINIEKNILTLNKQAFDEVVCYED